MPKKEGSGGLVYPFDVKIAATAVRFHRTSARVLWELYRSPATRLEPLYESLRAAVASDARSWLCDARISVHAFGVEDFAAGSRQVVGTVKNALVDGAAAHDFALTVDPDSPELLFDVRLVDNQVSVSIDLAGRPMHQRGYRHAAGIAPLREDLAAILVMLTRHDSRQEVLLDPMAGSGTIAIEAASMAKARYNWSSGRGPVCAGMKVFTEEFETHRKALFADTEPLVIANEPDDLTAQIAERNIDTAGVAPDCHLWRGDFRSIDAERVRAAAADSGFSTNTGVILSNPPYGERLKPDDLNRLYRDLGEWCRRFPGWRAGFLVANPDFEYQFGARADVKKPLLNGPLKANFYLYQL
jgi:23S rRNA G2445 N2-methylase RlmL